MGIVLKLLQGDIVWATFFGDFRSKYCCHMPVSGIIPYTFSYQITAFFTEFFPSFSENESIHYTLCSRRI